MKILVAGQKEFGRSVFNLAVAMGIDVVAVAAPALRDTNPEHRDRLRAAAEDAGVHWMPSGTLTHQTCPSDLDLIVAAHSHDFLGGRTIAKARLGAIGYHPSLLPRHRGRDAVRWTIHMRDQFAGGTVYWMTNRADAGPIAAQSWCHVRAGDDAAELWRRDLGPMGVRLLAKVVDDVARGRIIRRPQDEALATWEPAFDRPALSKGETPDR